MVLVHGLGVSSAYMVPLLETIGGWARCWAPDLPGHGRSSSPGRPLRFGELVTVLDDWMGTAGLERPLLVANSYGCQLAAALALRTELAGLVLVGPTTDTARRALPHQAARLLADQLAEPPQLVVMQALDYIRTGASRTLQEFRDGQRDDLAATLANVTAPVVLARGERDAIAPRDWLLRLADACPGARVEQVPAQGHCVNYTTPHVVSGYARSLLH